MCTPGSDSTLRKPRAVSIEITINIKQEKELQSVSFSVLTYGLYSFLALSFEWQVLAWFYLYNGTSSTHTHLQENQSKILIVKFSTELEKNLARRNKSKKFMKHIYFIGL